MTPTIEQVISAVAKEYGYSNAQLIGLKRYVELVRPRHIAIWLAYEYTDSALVTIGRRFKRDHSTITYAIQKVEDDEGMRLEAGVIATAKGWQPPSASLLGWAGARAADFMLRSLGMSKIRTSKWIKAFGTWVVTTAGVECLTDKYVIEKKRLGERWLLCHMREKGWVNMIDFKQALEFGRRYYKSMPLPTGPATHCYCAGNIHADQYETTDKD